MDDLDYLFSTAKIRAMEGSLLTKQRLNELIGAKKLEDAQHILDELGWEDPDFSSYDAMDKTIGNERHRIFKELGSFAPDKRLINVFQLKYDYHNLKAILKAKAQDKEFSGILSTSGRITPQQMTAMLNEENYSAMSPAMRKATEEASEVLSRTGDPLFADIALDRACYDEMIQMAKASESEFLRKYIALKIDSINLLAAVRIKKRGLPYEYLRQSFINGGSVDITKLLTELSPDTLESAFAASELLPAAQVGGQVLRDEVRLAALDTACDDCLMNFLKTAKYIGLGEQPLVGYAAAKEAELMAVRIVFSGKLAGIEPEAIKERLRESYV